MEFKREEEIERTYRESEEEDELEGELAEFLEAEVAENYETWPNQRETRRSAVNRRQNQPIARRQIPQHCLHRRHSQLLTALIFDRSLARSLQECCYFATLFTTTPSPRLQAKKTSGSKKKDRRTE